MTADEMTPNERRAAVRAMHREWDWSNPRCPISDIQHPPDEHRPECQVDDDEDDE